MMSPRPACHGFVLCLILGGLVFACGPERRPVADSKDVATDYENSGVTYLYYEDGNDIVRSVCRTDTRIHDRGTCQERIRRTSARAFWERLGQFFGSDLNQRDQEVGEIYTLIGRLDARLIMIVSADPAPTRQDLLPEIQALEQALALLSPRIVTYKEQVARIEAQLAQADDPDLRAQMALLSEQLAEAITEQDQKQSELAAKRQEFVLANVSLIDQVEFAELQARRRDLVRDLTAARTEIERALQERMTFARAMKRVQDQLFVHEHLRAMNPSPVTATVVRRFAAVFDEVDLRERTFPGTYDGRAIRFGIESSVTLESFHCTMEVNPLSQCSMMSFERYTGNTLDFHFATEISTSGQLTMTADFVGRRYSHQELRDLIGRDLTGDFRMRPACAMIGSWNIRNVDCRLIRQ